jgi:hypothetical protein
MLFSCGRFCLWFLSDITAVRKRGKWLVGWGTMLKAARLQVQNPVTSLDFSFDLILPGTIWPWDQTEVYQELVSESSWRNL